MGEIFEIKLGDGAVVTVPLRVLIGELVGELSYKDKEGNWRLKEDGGVGVVYRSRSEADVAVLARAVGRVIEQGLNDQRWLAEERGLDEC